MQTEQTGQTGQTGQTCKHANIHFSVDYASLNKTAARVIEVLDVDGS